MRHLAHIVDMVICRGNRGRRRAGIQSPSGGLSDRAAVELGRIEVPLAPHHVLEEGADTAKVSGVVARRQCVVGHVWICVEQEGEVSQLRQPTEEGQEECMVGPPLVLPPFATPDREIQRLQHRQLPKRHDEVHGDGDAGRRYVIEGRDIAGRDLDRQPQGGKPRPLVGIAEDAGGKMQRGGAEPEFFQLGGMSGQKLVGSTEGIAAPAVVDSLMGGDMLQIGQVGRGGKGLPKAPVLGVGEEKVFEGRDQQLRPGTGVKARDLEGPRVPRQVAGFREVEALEAAKGQVFSTKRDGVVARDDAERQQSLMGLGQH